MTRRAMRTVQRREIGARPGPAGRIPASERHVLAVRQSLRWAQRSGREGDYDRALSALAMVERLLGGLPDSWQRQREDWVAAWTAQARRRELPGLDSNQQPFG